MPVIKLILQPEPHWPDLLDKLDTDQVIHLGNGAPALQIAALPAGMASGRPSVCLRLDLPDGRTVLAETSLRLFVNAARALAARYPDDGAD